MWCFENTIKFYFVSALTNINSCRSPSGHNGAFLVISISYACKCKSHLILGKHLTNITSHTGVAMYGGVN